MPYRRATDGQIDGWTELNSMMTFLCIFLHKNNKTQGIKAAETCYQA